MSSEDHPIWNILRTMVMFGGLTILLYVNASSFDWPEVRTILELLGLKFLYEGGRKVIIKNGEKNNGEEARSTGEES